MIDEHYIETEELHQFLAMWRLMKQLYETYQYDRAVAEFGADMVAHHNLFDIKQAIAMVEAQIAERS